MKRNVHVAVTLLVLMVVPAIAGAWGLQGHYIIGKVATTNLSPELPAFVRTQVARSEITYLQSEEDRLKIGEGDEVAWTREWTTDHYVDMDDNGKIGGVLSLAALPPTRDEFERLLMSSREHVDAYKVGFLPYAILEGYEQVRSDFGLWRLAVADAKLAKGDAGRAAAAVVKYREELTLHDIGIFSHFVGDGSQPLHVTIHYNGWGPYPNPRGFSTDRTTHAEFEDTWIDRYLTSEQVMPFFQPAVQFSTIPLREIERYIAETDSYVVPFYEQKARGAFRLSDTTSRVHRDGVRFAARRLAAASRMLDSLILTAWRTSIGMRKLE